MELVDQYQLPSSVPDQLGASLLARGYDRNHSIIQSRILDAGTGIWAQAAQESGWGQILDYLLPHRTARLLLAYSDRVPRFVDDQARVALRALTMAINYRRAHTQIDVLNRRNEELSNLLTVESDNLTEGVIVLDTEGRVTACNIVGGQLLGYAPQEVIGLPVEGVLASRADIKQYVQRVLSGQSALESCQLYLFHRHGEPISASLRIASLRLPSSSIPGGALVFFAERSTEQMEAAEKDLRQKNAELKRMISILAHEIRNPLGSIKAVLDYLKPVFSRDESTSQNLKTIQNEIRRMDRLLRDALLVARPSELQTGLCQITELLDSLLDGRSKLFEEQDIQVRCKYQPDLPHVWIDRVQMEQVFDNLIINAVHAMSNGGFLTIEAEVMPTPDGRSAVLEVKVGDSGPGIPPEVLDRIFDPFFTTKEGGTGLGLAVARRIVKEHNGTLEVESWPGIGTIFEVILPLEEGGYE
jgi:PAS domain S-box-containing protein